jgi:serine/threonine protein kinase
VTAATTLNHPHVVTVHSLEKHGGILFITMELVDGATVADILPPQGLSIERWLPLAIQLADALAAAHGNTRGGGRFLARRPGAARDHR